VQRTFAFGLPGIGHRLHRFSWVLGFEKIRAAKMISILLKLRARPAAAEVVSFRHGIASD
jgi:hypothetical protein